LAANAIAAPTTDSPPDGQNYTAGVGQITFQATLSADALAGSGIDFYVTRDKDSVSAGVFSPYVDRIAGVGGPTVFTGSSTDDDAWPNRPGNYWWQAVQQCDPLVLTCTGPSAAVAFDIDPAPVKLLNQGKVELNTYLTKHPKHRTHRRKVKFKFNSNVEGARFRCLYAHGWSRCHSPHVFRHLRPGRYKFKVRAVVNGERDSSPAKWVFRILR
jgi:hypothetical protein